MGKRRGKKTSENRRKGYENGVNAYVMTMISREPRQIVALEVKIKTHTGDG
ncbi:MAG: hypothetical protein LBR74_00875 [Eubacterium sp.]|jgi:hypothetical protein|nr:hypothetical protein [Eubacterium sp.]